MSKKFKYGFLVSILAIGIFAAGYTKYSDVYFKIKKNFAIFSEAYQEVVLEYVEEVDPGELMDVALSAMMDHLDPYTTIIDQSKNQKLDVMTSGRYGGVGVEVGIKGDKIVVVAPMEGYPAYQKGIRAGDVIVKVNDIPTDELTPEEIQNVMRGDPGTSVSMTVDRFGIDERITFNLKREYIEVKNVGYAGLVGPQKNTGYILLNRFSKNTGEEVRKTLQQFQAKTDLDGLILDLRNNPGGLLGEAVKTVDKFVEPGIMVVETKGRGGEQDHVYRSEEPAMLKDMPLVVLQNGGSASASEVVAGALQDLDRAVIMGEQSFGKGLVQVVRSLPYDMALKMTTSKYYTPSGRSIQSVNYSNDDSLKSGENSDSSRKTFKTNAGRTVYDSEGIIPDVKIDERKPSLLEVALHKNSHYFFYANQYASDHDTLMVEQVTDSIYADFRSYLENQDFSFTTKAEKEYQALKNKLAEDTLKAETRSALNQIVSVMDRQKRALFEEHKKSIREELYLELVARYNGKNGRIRESTRFDDYVQRALDVLYQPQTYQDILSPKK